MNPKTHPQQSPAQGAAPSQQSRGHGEAQRKSLEQSQRKANEDQPEDFKDEETADKVVEIGPDMTKAPIKGIDPAQKR